MSSTLEFNEKKFWAVLFAAVIGREIRQSGTDGRKGSGGDIPRERKAVARNR
jgi:hypothetical protein